jgi:hypothetical protein
MTAITSDAAVAVLTAHWASATKQPELAGERCNMFFYSNATDLIALMQRGRHGFTALIAGLEDGALYTAKGPAPKAVKGMDRLMPAKGLRRGKPLGGRNVTNAADAEWAVHTALTTRGTFVKVVSVTHVVASA